MNQIPIFCMWQLTGPGDDDNCLCLLYSKHHCNSTAWRKPPAAAVYWQVSKGHWDSVLPALN